MEGKENNKSKEFILRNKCRYTMLSIIMLILFSIIIFRLLNLQVVNHQYYKEKADKRLIKFIEENALRGKIFESNGSILATNKLNYSVSFIDIDNNDLFYSTVDNLYNILKNNGKNFIDNFPIKIDKNNELYFEFSNNEEKKKKQLEIDFKKNRQVQEVIKKGALKIIEDENEEEKLLAITAKDTFEYLISYYEIYNILNLSDKEERELLKLGYKEVAKRVLENNNLESIRRYILIKDSFKINKASGYNSIKIVESIDEKCKEELNREIENLKGVSIDVDSHRYYPYDELASSVIGYTSSINSANKDKYEERGYNIATDLIGKAGIESAFESSLRGSKGGSTIKINSLAQITEVLNVLEPSSGYNIHLTLDKNIQYSMEEMLRYQLDYLQNKNYEKGLDTTNATRGAAVAVEVDTGRVLGLVSEPGYDPNIFSQNKMTKELSDYYFNPDLESFGEEFINTRELDKTVDELFPLKANGNREDVYDIYPKPFYNYATMGLVSPGSTFKPLMSVVALEEEVFTIKESINVTSKIFNKHPDFFEGNFPKDDNILGKINLKTALEHSSNSYYYESAVRLYKKYNESIEGLNSIAKYAWKFGLGVNPKSNEKATTGIEINENFGKVYNFEDFKSQIIYYSKWRIVDGLEIGRFENAKKSFPPVDIAKNNNDSNELASAKIKLKEIINNKLSEVGKKDISKDRDELVKEIIESLNNIYEHSDKYKKNLKDQGGDINTLFKLTAEEMADFVISTLAKDILDRKELAYAAIGQSMSSFTPLQLANYTATLANGGKRYKFHLVDKITDNEGNVIESFKPEIVDEIEIKEENLNAIKEGMRRVNHENGTASSQFKKFPIETAGKTGTAIFRLNQKEIGREDFGVYISFAPVEEPKIAVAVVIYDGGHGYYGAPVARAAYETYYRNEIKENSPYYTPRYIDGQTYDFTLNPPLEDK